MSTKTTFKRIALVAVASMGFGVLSFVPANAADNFNATFTAPAAYDTQIALVGGTNTVANVGTVTLNLATLNTPLTPTTDTATVTLSSAGTTKDNNFLGALTLSLATSGITANTGADAYNGTGGYNQLNNGVVTTNGTTTATLTAAAADFGTASGRVFLNVARAALVELDSGAIVNMDLSVSSGGVIQTFRQTLTLTIGTKTGTATRTPVLRVGAINAGGTATSTLTQPYTNVAALATIAPAAFTLTGTSTGSTFTVTAVATGGSVTLVRTNATTFTPSIVKNAIPGDLSVTYTFTVTAPATAGPGDTIIAGGVTWTVQPYTPEYAYSTAEVTATTAGYYASAAVGGDGIIWGVASNRTGSVATVTVIQKDQRNTTITNAAYAKTVTATITGKGSLTAVGSTTAVVKSLTWSVATANSSGTTAIDVYSEGTSGEGTLTVTVNGVSAATYVVRFLGDAATISAEVLRPIGSALGAENGTAGSTTTEANVLAAAGTTQSVGATTAPAIAVVVKDSNGWNIPTAEPLAAISDVTVVQSTERKFIDSGVSVPSALKFSAGTFVQHFTYRTNANLSGKTATITYSLVNAAGERISATPVTVTLGGPATKVVLTITGGTNVGERATMTFTATDAAGNKSFDKDHAVALKSNIALTTALGQVASIPTLEIVNGVDTIDFFNPLVTGTVSVTGLVDVVLPVSASSTVKNSDVQAAADATAAAADAAAEATDAANAATDAANAAAEAADAATAAAQDAADAVAALSTQVTELVSALRKQITSLTNLVIKIQKKVRA